ncbi:MAG: PQQ-dependent sugar dehydrogenase [Gammaproteobacteria bacterium]|jgi:glucose/arabinose dehydrogenase
MPGLRPAWSLLAVLLLWMPAAMAAGLHWARVADGFNRPLFVTTAGDGSGRLYVVEQGGRIYSMTRGGEERELFADVGNLITQRGFEQGLLGLAFAPRYRENGRLFLYYTRDPDGAVTLAEFRRGADGRLDPDSRQVLLTIPEPASNHNGGMLAFGPDGYLYLGPGDGGRGGDPWGNAQNRDVLLGKLLRIDVSQGKGYRIPPDNPFVNKPGMRPEIWAYGLRNPWRFSFDRRTGDLWIADVGQNAWEEIDHQPRGEGGRNYGWNRMEGLHCYPEGRLCDSSGLVLPVAEYAHDKGCSVTGGYVYRGAAIPSLAGVYVFGDYCSGRVWGLWPEEKDKGKGYDMRLLMQTGFRITSFGEDARGELYLVDQRGGIYRLEQQQ